MRGAAVALALFCVVGCGAAFRTVVSDAGRAPYSVVKMPGAVYPLRPSANRRYLVDRKGRPFLMVGDSPQAIVANLTTARMERYFAERHETGFNAAWVNLLCNTGTGGRPDGTTADGIRPFTVAGDLSTPNPAYFDRVDAMLRIAAKYGVVVLLDPVETGGWLETLLQNGPEKDFAYGRYLGARYRTFPNIIWFNGNDLQEWRNPTVKAAVQAVARGIRATDRNHIHTLELNYQTSGSLDDPTWRPLIGLDAAYTYYPTYAQVLKEYNRRDHLPTFMVEASYEFENYYKGPQTLRRQEYWTLLSGATGQLYGSRFTWQFISGWQFLLDTVGVAQLSHVTKLFADRRWWELVPDQKHRLVTAGYGTFATKGEPDANDYVTAAGTPDGRLAIAYLPVLRPVTVNLRQLSGHVRAQWYDPTTGQFSTVPGSPFANSRSRTFAPPGKNHDGDGDWALVLTTV
jgi:hypothetical protein